MDLLEHEGKELFGSYAIPIAKGVVIRSGSECGSLKFNRPIVKAQIPFGKRGKSGGIIVSSKVALSKDVRKILNGKFSGFRPQSVLVEEYVDHSSEFYLSVTLSREHKSLIAVFCENGGVDIEAIAKNNASSVIKQVLPGKLKLANKKLERSVNDLISKIVKLMRAEDATLVEINPLAMTPKGLIALDAKVVIDDSALFRHPSVRSLPIGLKGVELSAKKKGIQYVALDGDIGVVGNGAGLVMSTLDSIAHFGGCAANFLDVGGGASRKVMLDSLRLCASNPRVKGILINVFGGITHCDEIARGILSFVKNSSIPLVVRMTGTGADKAKELLEDNGISVLASSDEAAKEIVRLVL